MSKTIRFSLERELPKERAPHLPTKAHKSKKTYNRKKAKRELRRQLQEYR